jgi:hypothetical protein
MAANRSKYKRLPDLYVVGKELVFKEDVVMWLQALNPFQMDEARHDAQVARSRIVMALKSEHGSDERSKVTASLFEDGRDAAVLRLVEAKVGEKILEVVAAIQNDPDWKERLEIQERADDIRATPKDEAEIKLLEQIEGEYVNEVVSRQETERDYYMQHYAAMDEAALTEAYIDWYVERRGSTVAMAEYTLTEAWYGSRVCDGKLTEAGWDHSGCDHHQMLAFDSKAGGAELPEDIQQMIADGLRELNMTVREAKNSLRQGSSSESSPLPSAPAASTPSTQDATPVGVPGT